MITLYILFAHLVAEFIIQTDNVAKLKKNNELKGFFYHGLGVFLTILSIVLFIDINSSKAIFIKIIILVPIIHLSCDWVEEYIKNKFSKMNIDINIGNMIIFIVDQVIHIVIILYLTNNVLVEPSMIYSSITDVVFQENVVYYDYFKMIFIILYVSLSGAYFIPLVFNVIYRKIDNYTKKLDDILKKEIENQGVNTDAFVDEIKVGKWVGVLERILILIFVYAGQFSSIGFIIAVKTLARFKMMENKVFSEYYLLGTLLSVVYTFVCYSILEMII